MRFITCALEERVQMKSLALADESHRGFREGILDCRQQILATPRGQQFLHILHKDLVADFCKSPALLELLAGVMEGMLEEGCRFMLAKKGLEDTRGTSELEELLSAISNPLVAL